ncbi:MAG: Calx-beta domain-containing protein [Chloroflexota bacterium]
MKTTNLSLTKFFRVIFFLLAAVLLAGVGLPAEMGTITAVAAPLANVGYEGLDYKLSGVTEPTSEMAQSKLWFNDGSWWASLLDKTSASYHIYQLDWATQQWNDTGVELDDRPKTKADVLWDGTYLYVASSSTSDPINLYRYAYSNGTYTLSSGYPVQLSSDKARVVVIDKDSTDTLWITYTQGNKVYMAHSDGADDSWVTPYLLPVAGSTGLLSVDISAVVAYNGHVGVMWSNQGDMQMHFAVHQDGASDTAWTEVIAYALSADDHVSLRSLNADSAGNVFAAVKGSFVNPDEPQIIVLACTTGNCSQASNWRSAVAFSRNAQPYKTRPTVLLDTTNREIYVFVTDTGGGNALYKKASYDTLAFPAGSGTVFIDYSSAVNNVTSTKQTVNVSTGIVVMASSSSKYYHNCLELNGSGICPDPNKSSLVEFASATVDANESAGTATVTVKRVLATNTVVSVDYATSDGTAVSGLDYTSKSGTLTFNAGETEKTFTVPINNDALDEADVETVQLTLSNPTNDATLGGNATSTLNIADDDATPTVQLSSAAYSVNEADGEATITVQLSAASGREVTVQYATADGTAVSPADYTPLPLTTLTFASGTISQTFTVEVVNDALFEEDEFVGLVLSTPTNATLGTPASGALTIVDDEAPPTVSFDSDTISIAEDGGSAEVEVWLSSLSTLPISVDYVVSDGTAVAGEDYTTVAAGTLTFASEEGSKLITVPITDDALDEDDETITLVLSNVVGAEASLGSTPEATLTVLDNDEMPTVQISSEAVDVDEDAGEAVVTVTLGQPSGREVSVDFATAEETAVAGDDYATITGTLTFAPGETSGEITIPVLDDELDEADETLALTISNFVNARVGSNSDTQVRIVDNDAEPTVSFDQEIYPVQENQGPAVLTISLSAPSGQTVTVRYKSNGGSASAGGDYASVDKKLTFDPGETSQTVEVGVFDDALVEGLETAVIALSNPENVTIGDIGSATINLLDNEVPMLNSDSLDYSVAEKNGKVRITLTLDEPFTMNATVEYATVDGTAEAGSDYVAKTGKITFAPGQTSKTIEVELLEDELTEGDETFTLVFSNPINLLLAADELPITVKDGNGAVMIYLPIIKRP